MARARDTGSPVRFHRTRCSDSVAEQEELLETEQRRSLWRGFLRDGLVVAAIAAVVTDTLSRV